MTVHIVLGIGDSGSGPRPNTQQHTSSQRMGK